MLKQLNICMDLNILLLLLVKHAIIDMPIQRMHGPLNKANWRSKKAHLHYGGHAFGTFLVFIMFVGPITALIAGAIDWILHWHIDWLKSNSIKDLNIESHSVAWWWITAADQSLHYLSYFLIVILL